MRKIASLRTEKISSLDIFVYMFFSAYGICMRESRGRRRSCRSRMLLLTAASDLLVILFADQCYLQMRGWPALSFVLHFGSPNCVRLAPEFGFAGERETISAQKQTLESVEASCRV